MVKSEDSAALPSPQPVNNLATPNDWIEERRGFGSVTLSNLSPGQFVTASGLDDGGYIVWRKKAKGETV